MATHPSPPRTAREGLAATHHERPDLILCDIRLPKVNGYEVARAVKSHPDLCTIPLVAVTAYAMVGDRDRTLAAGFDGYVAKPITPETFVGQVEAYLQPRPSGPKEEEQWRPS